MQVYVYGIIFYEHKVSAKFTKLVVGMYNRNGYHWVLVVNIYICMHGISFF